MLFSVEWGPDCPLAASTLCHHGSAQTSPCTTQGQVGSAGNQRSCGVNHPGEHKSMAWTKALAGTARRAASALLPAEVAPKDPLNIFLAYHQLQKGSYEELLLLLLLLSSGALHRTGPNAGDLHLADLHR